MHDSGAEERRWRDTKGSTEISAHMALIVIGACPLLAEVV